MRGQHDMESSGLTQQTNNPDSRQQSEQGSWCSSSRTIGSCSMASDEESDHPEQTPQSKASPSTCQSPSHTSNPQQHIVVDIIDPDECAGAYSAPRRHKSKKSCTIDLQSKQQFMLLTRQSLEGMDGPVAPTNSASAQSSQSHSYIVHPLENAGLHVAVDLSQCSTKSPTHNLVAHSSQKSGSFSKANNVCRVCLELVSKEQLQSKQGYVLGCNCMNGQSAMHTQCLQSWFGPRGSCLCEVCNEVAENIVNVVQYNHTEPSSAVEQLPSLCVCRLCVYPVGVVNDTRDYWVTGCNCEEYSQYIHRSCGREYFLRHRSIICETCGAPCNSLPQSLQQTVQSRADILRIRFWPLFGAAIIITTLYSSLQTVLSGNWYKAKPNHIIIPFGVVFAFGGNVASWSEAARQSHLQPLSAFVTRLVYFLFLRLFMMYIVGEILERPLPIGSNHQILVNIALGEVFAAFMYKHDWVRMCFVFVVNNARKYFGACRGRGRNTGAEGQHGATVQAEGSQGSGRAQQNQPQRQREALQQLFQQQQQQQAQQSGFRRALRWFEQRRQGLVHPGRAGTGTSEAGGTGVSSG